MFKSDFTLGRHPLLDGGLTVMIASAFLLSPEVQAQLKLDVVAEPQALSQRADSQANNHSLIGKSSSPQGTLPHNVIESQEKDISTVATHARLETEVEADRAVQPMSSDVVGHGVSKRVGTSVLPKLEGATLASNITVDTPQNQAALLPAASTGSLIGAQSTTNSSISELASQQGPQPTLLAAQESSNSDNTEPNTSLQAQNGSSDQSSNQTSTANTADASTQVANSATNSMIKPNRPNGLLYSTAGKAQEPTAAKLADADSSLESTSSSLVEVDSSQTQVGTPPKKTVVIFFSAPEAAHADDIDVLTGASLIERNDQLYGITEYIATYIGQKMESQVYKLSAEPSYPAKHDALIERTNEDIKLIKEQNFTLTTKLEPELDLSQVEKIYLGFPLWWNDLPLPVYAFLEQHDLSGKTIIPFCTYGSSMPYQLFKRLNELEPNAKILMGLEINKHRLVKKQLLKRLDRWLEEKGPISPKRNKQ